MSETYQGICLGGDKHGEKLSHPSTVYFHEHTVKFTGLNPAFDQSNLALPQSKQMYTHKILSANGKAYPSWVFSELTDDNAIQMLESAG